MFRSYDQFAAINPVVKAPTLVTDEGVVLMDSSLILEYVERRVAAEKSLTPMALREHARSQRIISWRSPPVRRQFRSSMNASCRRQKNSISRGSSGCAARSGPPMTRSRAKSAAGTGCLPRGRCRPISPRQSPGASGCIASATSSRQPIVPRWRRFSARAESLPEFASLPFD